MCQRGLKTEDAGVVKRKIRLIRYKDGGHRHNAGTRERQVMAPAEVAVGGCHREKDGRRVGTFLQQKRGFDVVGIEKMRKMCVRESIFQRKVNRVAGECRAELGRDSRDGI